jgi:hypothetical protein
MNYILAQLIVAAQSRNDRDGSWMQILVFVILAIFYAVGSIVKAKAKRDVQKKEKQIPGKPARKAPARPQAESTIELQMLKQLFGIPEKPAPSEQPRPQVTKPQVARPQVQPPRRKVVRPQPAIGRKAAIKTEEAVKIPTFEPQVQPKLEKVPGLTGEAEVPIEISQTKYLSGILSDYDDAEKLRRAILHYEILGKPLSLRDPSEHII